MDFVNWNIVITDYRFVSLNWDCYVIIYQLYLILKQVGVMFLHLNYLM